MQWMYLGLDVATIVLLLLVLVFSIGIVWRVEKKLDLSYKFFVVAASCLTFGEVLSLYASDTDFFSLLGRGMRFLGAIFFLVSILLMRDIVRDLDHEKRLIRKNVAKG